MAIKKNVASQKLAVYAYDPTTAAGTDPSKTGDAANITAQISLDGGTSAATNDVSPTELDATDHPGVYIFDLTQAETNAEMILLSAVSSTSNILLDPIQVLTSSNADDVWDAQQSMHNDIGTLGAYVGFILGDTAELQADWVDGGRLDLLVDAIKAKTDDLTFTVANQVDANALTGGYSAGATIQSPVPSATTIEVINADRYDGTAAPLLTWTVTKDYSAATTVKLVIYKKGYPDTIYKTATGVVASATSITVDLDVDFGDSITFSGVPLKSELGFALVADWSGEEETIARGDCYVYDRGVPA